MKSGEKITIVVPVYNMERYLNRCMESILNQKYDNLAILAINDGSSDNSQKILEYYAKKDNRIKYITKENGGYGSVLKKALEIMSTDYFLICDSDDYLEPNAAEVLVKASTDSDIVYGKYYNIINNQRSEMIYSTFFDLIDNHLYKEELDRFVFVPVSPHAKLYKKELFDHIVLPEKIYFTDALLYYYALSRAKSLTYVDKYLANYYYDREGNTQTDTKPIVYDYHDEIVKQIVNQCDIKQHKYFALGLLFYNLYIMTELSKSNAAVIAEKKECIYDMFKQLITYCDIIDTIPESKESLIKLKNNLLSKSKYKETIDNMLSNTEETQKLFVKELTNLSRK